MLSTIAGIRVDVLADECQKLGSVAYIIGNVIVAMDFHTRTIHGHAVWLMRSIDAITPPDGGGSFPGVYVTTALMDRRKYTQYETKGVGITADGTSFDPRQHRMSKFFAVSESKVDSWEISHAAPFWHHELLKEVREYLAKLPHQPATSAALVILTKVLEQLYPSQPVFLNGATEPELTVYTMRQLPVAAKIAAHRRPAVDTKDPSLLHIIDCCDHIQNASYVQFVHDGLNVTFAKSAKWAVDDLEFLPHTHALPGLLWIQKRPSTDALELDPQGFGLTFASDKQEATTRQRTMSMLKRLPKGMCSRVSNDRSLADIFPCFGEVPALFDALKMASDEADHADEECIRLFRRLQSGIEASKRFLERKAAGKKGQLFPPPDMSIWTIKKTDAK